LIIGKSNQVQENVVVKLVLLRHGQSIWNHENCYTGWTDVDLTEKGVNEARNAGNILRESGYRFDIAYTSVLKRAIRSLWIVLDELNQMWLPYRLDWRLNERHYGALQGLNKAESVKEFGKEQVYLWRRSYTIRPPAINWEDHRHPRFDRRYSSLSPEILPVGESLEDTQKRVVAWWGENILVSLQNGQCVLVVAHGNSLRALVSYLDQIPPEEIPDLNIPTGIPRVYEFSSNLQIIRRFYLGDPEVIRAADETLRQQGMIRRLDRDT
jgi:2,3-bisphosphoglycerate-dependent phosphoglycerate mutase